CAPNLPRRRPRGEKEPTMPTMTTRSWLCSVLLSVTLLSAGCGGGGQPTPAPAKPAEAPKPAAPASPAASPAASPVASPGASPAASPAAGAPPAAKPAALSRIGGAVSVIGSWGGSEQESFLAMVKPFEDQTGVTVEYEGTRDLNAI